MSDGHRVDPSHPAIKLLPRALEYTIRIPSGDQEGKLASPWSSVTWSTVFPSGLVTKSSHLTGACWFSERTLLENTSSLPSDDHSYSSPTTSGRTLPGGAFGSRSSANKSVSPEPSGWMTYT